MDREQRLLIEEFEKLGPGERKCVEKRYLDTLEDQKRYKEMFPFEEWRRVLTE